MLWSVSRPRAGYRGRSSAGLAYLKTIRRGQLSFVPARPPLNKNVRVAGNLKIEEAFTAYC